MFHDLGLNWTVAAMKLNYALKTDSKHLDMRFVPSEIICLAEMLKEAQGLKSINLHCKS